MAHFALARPLSTSSEAEKSCFLCLNATLSCPACRLFFLECFCDFRTAAKLFVPDRFFLGCDISWWRRKVGQTGCEKKVRDPNSKWANTGVRITCYSFFSTALFHLGIVKHSSAHHKCSATGGGGSKHRLSDLVAGTEQSPASHQSWQGWMAVWLLLMGGGREEEEEEEKKRRCQTTKRPLTAATPDTRIRQSWVDLCASVQTERIWIEKKKKKTPLFS